MTSMGLGNGIPADTSEDAYNAQVAVYRNWTPQQRIQRMLQMNQDARDLALADIRRAHPAWTEERVFGELMIRMHGVALARKLWPRCLEQEPPT